MKLEINSEMGILTTYVWSYYLMPERPPLSVTVQAVATINRVEYKIHLSAKRPEKDWLTSTLDLRRTDKKDTPFPYKAREKAEAVILKALNDNITENIIQQARDEHKKEQINETIAKIEQHKQEIITLQEKLKTLS